VMNHLTTEHLFTGSFPMRYVDVKRQWEKEREAGDVLFGVWLPANTTVAPSRFVGTCGLHAHRDIYRSWEARFLIFDAAAVGLGIGQEACELLVDYAFRKLNAHKVWLGVSADNLRAAKCYLNCGFIIEGSLRDEVYYEGTYHHVYRMSILEGEHAAKQA